jgi:hypothetical protein
MDRKVPYISILLILSTVLFLAIQPARAEELKKKTNSGSVNPVEGSSVDLGIVNIDGGMVEKVFELYNGESEDLVLKGAFTSCACTKASIELPDGNVSRPFGMSLPSNWFRVIKPGEKFKVRVQFDPAFHGKDGTGAFRRDIYLITSASPDDNLSSRLPMIRHGSVSMLRLEGNVVTAEEYKDRMPARPSSEKAGDFLFSATVLDAGVVKQSGPSVKFEMPFTYEGSAPVRVTGTPTSCACVSASISKKTLSPGESGVLTIEFDPNYHKEPEGRFFKDIIILTEPAQSEEVQIRLWAEVDLDLGPQAYKFKEHDDEDEHEEEEEDHR